MNLSEVMKSVKVPKNSKPIIKKEKLEFEPTASSSKGKQGSMSSTLRTGGTARGSQRRSYNFNRQVDPFTVKNDISLDIDQVYYHPSFAKNR